MKTKLVRRTLDIDNPPPLTAAQEEELARLAAMPEDAIDFSDIPQKLDWSNAVRFRDRFHRPVKQSTTVRLDADVLHWLKAKGKGYQTRLNAILREAMMREVS